MARPRAKELTQRELDIMHVFRETGEATVAQIRDRLEELGHGLAHTTVATLIRILTEKGFLDQTNAERPFVYRSLRSFEDVSTNMVGDLVARLFGGSREKLLVQLLDQQSLTPRERELLEEILRDEEKER